MTTEVKKKIKAKKKSKAKTDMSPEAIAEKRRQREEKKRLRAELIAQGIDPDQQGAHPLYIKRELLTVPHEHQQSPSLDIKIMTYNLLAQSLIRRTLFPDNGSILKWNTRSKPLFQEVKDYNCDIMCFQELDYNFFEPFWKTKLKPLGYNGQFYRSSGKNHGVAIFYRTSLFTLIDTCHIDYDQESSGTIPPRTTTTNIGLILCLGLNNHSNAAICIGTNHLFWHPFGTYERTRQTYVMLSKCGQFQDKVQNDHPEITKVWKFFAGDFNSQPYDSPYLSITSKPVHYDERCRTVIECSTSFTYSSRRDGGGGEDEEGGNIEKFGDQPTDPVPDQFNATEEQVQLVQDMEDLHNSLPLRATSMYSVGYALVDPANAGYDNDRNEPAFSNWAHAWRGLLDYIFMVQPWNGDDCRAVDDLDVFETRNNVTLNKLLKLPLPKEMDKGQPRKNEYPSDHLCLIADVGLHL